MSTITKYEIVATKADKRYVVAYTARKTKQSLVRNLMTNAAKIVAAIDANADAVITKASREKIVFDDGTVIMFSGYTEKNPS